MVVGATGSTGATMGAVCVEIDLASVGRDAIAVAVTGVAARQNAAARAAASRCVGKTTGLPA